MSLGEPGVKTWCRSLFTQIVATEGRGRVTLSPEPVEELDILILLLDLSEGSPLVSPVHDMEIWVDSGEVGWGGHTMDNISVSSQFKANWIGTSSTTRELRGLCMAISAMSGHLKGKVVRLNMDNMCSVRNIIKGGGPVRLLCALVKALWQLCKQLDIQLVPRWQRRSGVDMQKADDLSKVGTLWEMLPSFKARVLEQHGVLVSMPGSGRRHVQVRGLLTWQR